MAFFGIEEASAAEADAREKRTTVMRVARVFMVVLLVGMCCDARSH